MLTKKQIEEFRAYLKKAENPLFFFDDDPDGLCSYLILKKYIGKGKGVVLKTKPTLSVDFYRKIEEYCPDYVFILDIALVEQEFLEKINVPVIWLDHHQPQEMKGVHYYNPMMNKPKDNRPTTYYANEIAENQFLWLATLGTISDWYYPKFAKEFSKLYPNILPKNIKKANQAIFDSRLGDLIMTFAFLLKGMTSKVHRMASLLLKIDDPNELLENITPRAKFINKEVVKLKKEYVYMLKQVESQKPGKEKLFIVYLPISKNSFTSQLSNLMIYRYPKKVIMVIRQKDDIMVMSARSAKQKIEKIFRESLEGLDGIGGGHDLACGGTVAKDQFNTFLERFKEKLK
nr:hypothetical protein [Nanoarchaeum sp.]